VAVRALKRTGFAILFDRRNFRFASTISERHYAMGRGRVVGMTLDHPPKKSMGGTYVYFGV